MTQIGNDRHAWGTVQQTLHWTIGVAVVAQLSVGLIFSRLPEGDPSSGTYFGIHGTLGTLILVAMLCRFVWRQMHPVPALPNTLSPALKKIARGTHWAVYVLLIGMPIGGWLMVNARGYRVSFFGQDLPALISKNESLAGGIFVLHASGGFLLIALIVLHVAAALRHEFLLKDDTLRRMTPLPLRARTEASFDIRTSAAETRRLR